MTGTVKELAFTVLIGGLANSQPGGAEMTSPVATRAPAMAHVFRK